MRIAEWAKTKIMELKSWFECNDRAMATTTNRREKRVHKGVMVCLCVQATGSNWSITRQTEWMDLWWIYVQFITIHASHGKLNIKCDWSWGEKQTYTVSEAKKPNQKTILTFLIQQPANYIMIKFIRRKDAHSEWASILSFLRAISIRLGTFSAIAIAPVATQMQVTQHYIIITLHYPHAHAQSLFNSSIIFRSFFLPSSSFPSPHCSSSGQFFLFFLPCQPWCNSRQPFFGQKITRNKSIEFIIFLLRPNFMLSFYHLIICCGESNTLFRVMSFVSLLVCKRNSN